MRKILKILVWLIFSPFIFIYWCGKYLFKGLRKLFWIVLIVLFIPCFIFSGIENLLAGKKHDRHRGVMCGPGGN